MSIDVERAAPEGPIVRAIGLEASRLAESLIATYQNPNAQCCLNEAMLHNMRGLRSAFAL